MTFSARSRNVLPCARKDERKITLIQLKQEWNLKMTFIYLANELAFLGTGTVLLRFAIPRVPDTIEKVGSLLRSSHTKMC